LLFYAVLGFEKIFCSFLGKLCLSELCVLCLLAKFLEKFSYSPISWYFGSYFLCYFLSWTTTYCKSVE